MTQEEKEVLLRDLSAKLPYEGKGVVFAEVSTGRYDINGDIIFYEAPFDVVLDTINVSTEEIHVTALGNEDTVEFLEMQQTDGSPYTVEDFKPYLRPMSSMTEEERKEFVATQYEEVIEQYPCSAAPTEIKVLSYTTKTFDWLNKKHFDYRGLIPMGLAIAAIDENNPYKEKGGKNG